MIIWLIGISGSGKSTLGNLLFSQISKTGNKVRLIDGDIVRDFFNNDLGYSRKAREENIKRISNDPRFQSGLIDILNDRLI